MSTGRRMVTAIDYAHGVVTLDDGTTAKMTQDELDIAFTLRAEGGSMLGALWPLKIIHDRRELP